MIWHLSKDWGVTRDAYNWILLRRTGRFWKKHYYASAEQLLNSLRRKITRSAPPQHNLAAHLEVCLKIAQEFSRQLYRLAAGEPAPPQETRRKTRARSD